MAHMSGKVEATTGSPIIRAQTAQFCSSFRLFIQEARQASRIPRPSRAQDIDAQVAYHAISERARGAEGSKDRRWHSRDPVADNDGST